MEKPDKPALTPLEKAFGLDPIVAVFVIVIDFMLFGAELTVVGYLASLCVSVAIIPPCALMQRYNYGDNWGVAWSKSMMVGILTAIPTPLPSFITGTAGVVGYLKHLKNNSGE